MTRAQQKVEKQTKADIQNVKPYGPWDASAKYTS